MADINDTVDINEINDIDKQNLQESTTSIAKCPTCGADTRFEPSSQLLVCDYCGNKFDFKKSISLDKHAIKDLVFDDGKWQEHARVIRCNNCGAVEIIAKTDIVKECSYCHASNVVATQDLPGIKPDAVLPFSIDKDNASVLARKWIKGKWFVPKKYKQSFDTDDIRGLYNPAFTFDSVTFSSYTAKLGRRHTVVRHRTVNGKSETYTTTEIRWFNVSGKHNDFFQDILIQASTTISQKTIDKIEPFNIYNSKNYTDSFLYGFGANQYNKDGMDCWGEAKTVIDRNIQRNILSRYSYDVLGHINVKTDFNNIAYKYLLLPIYVGGCHYKKKNYNYFVNGTTGKTTGKVPKSAGKILGLIGAIVGTILVAGATYFLVKHFSG